MISTGIDIVKIDRIHKMCLQYHSDWWFRHIGSKQEWDYAHTKKKYSESLAGFFAAKESYIKAVSEHIKKPALQDIEIFHSPEGRPYISSNRSDLISNHLQVSISHEQEYAIAIVLFFIH
ncbi:MAG: holo-ACP synthase [Caldisericia bacterium]|nr:holo-ACP synthase [Caldisericia bacterium]MDD4615115.1 holo-ACP synthase [Caldisericia bacterium]